MRVFYVPENEKFWLQVLAAQQKQQFGGSGFSGIRYQRGAGLGSFFASLFRTILPAAKSFGKAALTTIGKEALSTGAKIASDMASGRSFKAAAEEHGQDAAKNLLAEAQQKFAQSGSGLGKRKPLEDPKSIKRKRTKRKQDIFGDYVDSE